MNDCFWCGIMVCDGPCMCDKYLSMNSEEGRELSEEYGKLVDEILKPLAVGFAKDKGFSKDA